MARVKKIARKKVAGKKTVSKKTAGKKAVSKNSAAKRSTKAAKIVARKKTAAKKTPVKKTSAKKNAAKKAPAKRTASKKTIAKKAIVKKATVKKAAVEKASSRAAKKSVAVKNIKASASASPPSRRQAPRNSSGRRLAARAPVSRAQLVKKTLIEAKRAKPANAQQKATQKAKQLRARKKALAAKDNRLPVQRSPSARVRRNDGPDAPSQRRLSIRAAVTRETSRSPAQRSTAAVGDQPFRLHQLGIRDEHPTDRAAILALLQETFGDAAQAEKLQALRLEDRIGGVLVAQHGERLVGCGALFLNAVESSDGDVPVAEIGVLAVSPSLQRKGIGTQLVLAMIESARASGAKVLLAQRLDELLGGLGFSGDSVSKLDGNMTVLGLKLAEDDENEVAGRLKLPIS